MTHAVVCVKITLDWHGGTFDPAALDRDRIDKAVARIVARRKRAAAKRAR